MTRLWWVALLVASVGCTGGEGTGVPTASEAVTPPADSTSITERTTTTTVSPTSTLAVEPLAACLTGEWTLDVDELHEAAQSLADPGAAEVIVGVVSGGGSLEFDSDSSFVVSFESLVLSYDFPPDDPGPLPVGALTDHEMIFEGQALADFKLDGSVLSVTDTSGPGLEIRHWFTEVGRDSKQAGPNLFFHPAALVLGADFVPPRQEGHVIVQCDGDRLVVDAVIDSDSVDVVAAVWRRK